MSSYRFSFSLVFVCIYSHNVWANESVCVHLNSRINAKICIEPTLIGFAMKVCARDLYPFVGCVKWNGGTKYVDADWNVLLMCTIISASEHQSTSVQKKYFMKAEQKRNEKQNRIRIKRRANVFKLPTGWMIGYFEYKCWTITTSTPSPQTRTNEMTKWRSVSASAAQHHHQQQP